MGTIATFASKVFQVTPSKLYTFDGFAYTSTLQTEKQDADGAKPSTYIKGPDLDTFSINLKLDVSMGVNPRNEWGDWERILEGQTTYPFILAGVPINNANWLLTSVSPSNANFDNNGNMLQLELALQFEEYVRPGSKKEKSSSSSGGKTTTSVPGLYDMLDNSTYAMPENTDLKRENTNMTWASR